MKIAIVYDRVNKYGGAERVLEALHEIWPDAPLYTAVYDPRGARWAAGFDVRPSFINRIPGANRHHELFAWLTPIAFESFTFDGFDAVISVTSAEAKNIITKPGTLHLCYLLTPTRYLWSGYASYMRNPGFGVLDPVARAVFRSALPVLRRTDRIASTRPDVYAAISETVSARAEKYYGVRPEEVIYPPVKTDVFSPGNGTRPHDFAAPSGYFLVVSRLVGYKRVDLLVNAFSQMKLPLVVIGTGREYSTLVGSAGPTVRFVPGDLTENELVYYYNQCRAFIFAGVEDFGLVAAEAQSCGKPVIAYGKSGIAEIVKDTKTGILFDDQSATGVKQAVERFESMVFSESDCRENARRFSVSVFGTRIKSIITRHLAAPSANTNL